MARRIIRRRRPTMSRRTVVRRSPTVDTPQAAPLPQPTVQQGSPILVATSNSIRNVVLPKLAAFDGILLAGLANSPDIALKMLIQEHPEAVILDIDFGGPLMGLDTARLMQKTRAQAAIIMLVPEIDPETHHGQARRFGTSWSYIKKSTATRENVLSIALKSAVRGVQWIEPELSRPLAELWKVASEARDLEARRSQVEPVAVSTALGRKAMKNSIDQVADTGPAPAPVVADVTPSGAPDDGEFDAEDDGFEDVVVAPGIELKTTTDLKGDGIDITAVSVGKGGIGQDVGKVRRAK